MSTYSLWFSAASDLEAMEEPLLDDADEDASWLPDTRLPEQEEGGAMRPLPSECEGSLGNLHRSVKIAGESETFCARLQAFIGPGAMVAVGYMDPGNWATDIAAGSSYNYKLLFIILVSSVFAMFLQALALRLGIAAQLDLAQACRRRFSRPVSIFMWITAEIAITACDLAEVVGSAIAMQLLFGLPLFWGVLATALDVLLLLALGGKSMRVMEIMVFALTSVVFVCFAIEIGLAQPDAWAIMRDSLIPSPQLLHDQKMVLISVGILGATIMPHNLYLHSSIVQTRDIPVTERAVRQSIFLSTIDSNMALSLAFFVNAAILILSAATFYRSGHTDVADIDQAYMILSQILGSKTASTLFAVALLASGQQSTLTGTLAGQIVMEGFVDWQMTAWKRRLLTRMLAIIPGITVVGIFGDHGVTPLLVGSQVVLSLQLPFSVFPLVYFAGDGEIMRGLQISRATQWCGWIIAVIIAGLNLLLIVLIVNGVV